MKKTFLSIVSIILMIVVLFTFTGCGKEKKEETKEFTYKDDESGYTLKFKAPKDSKFEVIKLEQDAGNFAEITIENKDLNLSFDMYFFEITDTSYDSIKESRSESYGYKDYKWNKYDGYAYNGDEDSISFNAYLRADDGERRAVCLFGSVECIDFENANVLEKFNGDEVQKFLGTMEFSE